MARLARMVFPGLAHHVTHRGNRRADVFVLEADRDCYKELLRDYASKAGVDLWAYCLMTNHVHLVAVPQRDDSLARGVGLAHRRYAAWLNQRQTWQGHLWANRFFSTALDDAHLWAAVRYVERNPVRAGLVERAADYPWSSARAHAHGEPDALLSPGRPFPGPIADWAAWLAAGDEEALMEVVRRSTRTGRPCGSEAFLDELAARLGRDPRPNNVGRPRAPRPPAPQADMFGE